MFTGYLALYSLMNIVSCVCIALVFILQGLALYHFGKKMLAKEVAAQASELPQEGETAEQVTVEIVSKEFRLHDSQANRLKAIVYILRGIMTLSVGLAFLSPYINGQSFMAVMGVIALASHRLYKFGDFQKRRECYRATAEELRDLLRVMRMSITQKKLDHEGVMRTLAAIRSRAYVSRSELEIRFDEQLAAVVDGVSARKK